MDARVSAFGRPGHDGMGCALVIKHACALRPPGPRTKPSPMTALAKSLRIGTRGSPLALAQAGLVRDGLAAAYPDLPRAEIVVIKTTGDRKSTRLNSSHRH